MLAGRVWLDESPRQNFCNFVPRAQFHVNATSEASVARSLSSSGCEISCHHENNHIEAQHVQLQICCQWRDFRNYDGRCCCYTPPSESSSLSRRMRPPAPAFGRTAAAVAADVELLCAPRCLEEERDDGPLPEGASSSPAAVAVSPRAAAAVVAAGALAILPRPLLLHPWCTTSSLPSSLSSSSPSCPSSLAPAGAPLPPAAAAALLLSLDE